MGRRIVFGLLLTAMLVPPALRQAFGVQNRFLREWAMMRGSGVGIADARFYAVEHGTRRLLDRRAVLSTAGWEQDYRHLLLGDGEVLEAAALLCAALGPQADVRAVARIAQRTGWQPSLDGQENLCAR